MLLNVPIMLHIIMTNYSHIKIVNFIRFSLIMQCKAKRKILQVISSSWEFFISLNELVSKEKTVSAAAECIKTTGLPLDYHGSSSSCDCHHCNLIILVDTPSAFNKYSGS